MLNQKERIKNLEVIQLEIFENLKEKQFKSFITLTYPSDLYPKDEKKIKNHLKLFTNKLQKQNKKDSIYFYVYELYENNMIHIHILSTLFLDKHLDNLKKHWLSIIGTNAIAVFNLKKITEQEITLFCSYLLKLINKAKNSERNILLKKLGQNSCLFGGS